ncbi:MAG: nuclear transport factor 2 family protein [Novosphingobium sp.]
MTTTQTTLSKDEQDVLAHYDNITEALQTRDTQRAMAGYDENVMVFDIAPPLRAIGKAHSEETYDTAFAMTKGPWLCEWREMKVKVIDATNAYVTGIFRQVYTVITGEQVSLTSRLTDIFEKKDGRWLVVHEHISTPVDMQTGQAEMNADLDGRGVPFGELARSAAK